MNQPPPPPPPHGENPRTTAGGSGLPPGKYDVFIIPEHSAGAGFLYLPSLRPQWNSFIAGVVSTMAVVIMSNLVSPMVMSMFSSPDRIWSFLWVTVVACVGVAAFLMGRHKNEPSGQQNKAGSGSGEQPKPGGGRYGGADSWYTPPPQNGSPPNQAPPPPPPPPPQQEAPRGGPGSYQSWQEQPRQPPQPEPQPQPQQQAPPPPPPPQPESQPPREEPKPEPKPAPEPRQQPQSPPPRSSSARTENAKGAWEKAREEMRRREEERKAKEAETKKKEETARRLRELREREARERERREREAREREVKEKVRQEQEAKERERLEREVREKVERELREKADKEAKERESKLKEEERARLERERVAARERERKEREERAEKLRKEQEEKEKSERKGTGYAYSSVGEKTSMWPNGKPPSVAPSQTASTPPPPRPSQFHAPPSPSKPAPSPTKSTASATGTEDTYSYRPYDKPKMKPTARKKSVSDFSESSWAPSASTARTTPPPSTRGPYTTNDPQKIIIRAVYGYLNQFSKTPASQLISGIAPVTDGLILRITSAGLFVDDDVRGVAQREWDVKAWTLKLVEVWCPVHAVSAQAGNTPGSVPSNHPFFKTMPQSARRAAERGATKTMLGEEAVAYIDEFGRVCDGTCRRGGGAGASAASGEGKAQGLHLLRATIRDQEGKRYLFVVDEGEAWKIAQGLAALRGSSQVRALGVAGFSGMESKTLLDTLGWGG